MTTLPSGARWGQSDGLHPNRVAVTPSPRPLLPWACTATAPSPAPILRQRAATLQLMAPTTPLPSPHHAARAASTCTYQWPSGVGSRNLQHWAQMFRDRKPTFAQYDFGGWEARRAFIHSFALLGRGVVSEAALDWGVAWHSRRGRRGAGAGAAMGLPSPSVATHVCRAHDSPLEQQLHEPANMPPLIYKYAHMHFYSPSGQARSAIAPSGLKATGWSPTP
jgi:hypothetical protein